MAQQGDVFWDQHYRSWCVLGYDAACQALTHADFSADISDFLLTTTFPRKAQSHVLPLVDFFKQWLFYLDPPQHTVLRRQLSTIFSQKAIAEYQPQVECIVAEVCGSQHGTFDFVTHVAQVIASRVMAHVLNLPADVAPQLLQWTFELAGFLDGFVRTPDTYQPALKAMQEMQSYFKSDWVLKTMLLTTGIDTTISFLSSAVYLLLQNPEQIMLLKNQPGLVDLALDEFIRFEPAAHLNVRRATCDLRFQGCDIKQGDMVSIFLAAANRDPRFFNEPNQLDLQRNPNPHLSFGYGIHYCLGRLLVRLTARTCIAYIFQHWPHLKQLDHTVIWTMGTSLRQIQLLTVSNSRD